MSVGCRRVWSDGSCSASGPGSDASRMLRSAVDTKSSCAEVWLAAATGGGRAGAAAVG